MANEQLIEVLTNSLEGIRQAIMELNENVEWIAQLLSMYEQDGENLGTSLQMIKAKTEKRRKEKMKEMGLAPVDIDK